MLRTLANLMRIRRMEFFVVEMTILFIPILVSIRSLEELRTRTFAEAFALFFVLYALGDGVNCLVDRDLDAVYKTRLSRAVYELGVPVVTALVVIEAVLSLVLGVHLAWVTGKWGILALVIVGLFLGLGYSVPPLQFKSKGILHLVCLWLLLFFVPMLYAGLLVNPSVRPEIVVLAAAYATAMMGIILINTAEDYPEDLEAKIRTTVVSLGVRRGVALAAWMVLVGGLAFLGVLASFYVGNGVSGARLWVLAVPAVAWILASRWIWTLRGKVRDVSLDDGMRSVRECARWVPLWATTLGWSGLMAAGALTLFR